MKKDPRVAELRKKLVVKAAKFKKLFSSPDGKEVLDMIEDEFLNKRLIGPDPHATTVLASQADVVQYIHQMINYKGEDDETELP